MTEQEALRDLVSSEGWEYLKAYITAELAVAQSRVFAACDTLDLQSVGIGVKIHKGVITMVGQFTSWPQRRADELDKREGRSSKPVTTDTRGGA